MDHPPSFDWLTASLTDNLEAIVFRDLIPSPHVQYTLYNIYTQTSTDSWIYLNTRPPPPILNGPEWEKTHILFLNYFIFLFTSLSYLSTTKKTWIFLGLPNFILKCFNLCFNGKKCCIEKHPLHFPRSQLCETLKWFLNAKGSRTKETIGNLGKGIPPTPLCEHIKIMSTFKVEKKILIIYL